ncbi:MAG: O-antigen ligase family protein [Dysosmobacter sp.]|nr:O-antigen ligase family protein [Dysosmobacter sp.]
MTFIRESALFHLWLYLLALYDSSTLHRLLTRAGSWCSRQINASRLLAPLCREGCVARAWPESLLCRALNFLVNLPLLLLQKLYTLLSPILEDSFFARFVFTLGDKTPSVQFWLILVMWSIPFSRWNNAYSLAAFFLLLLLFHAGAMRRREYRIALERVGFYPLLLFGSIFLAVVFSRLRSSSARFLVYHISAALCVIVTVSAVRHVEDLKRLAAGAAGCALTSSLYGIYQRSQGVKVNPSNVDLRLALNVGMPGRVDSIFDNANTFAEVLVLLLPLTLALALCSKKLLGKAMAFCAFSLGVVALGMTYSRASWVGFACALTVMIFLWKPKLIPAFALFCCLAVPLLPTTIWNRILTIGNLSDASTLSRIPLYEGTLRLIKASPISGAGLGTAAVQRYLSFHNLYRGDFPYVHAHNFYLQVWAEAGILGIISFLAAMLWGVKQAARTVRHCESSAARTITCGAAAALCGIMVCGLADYPWNYPRVMCIFWFVFAMALAGINLCSKTD